MARLVQAELCAETADEKQELHQAFIAVSLAAQGSPIPFIEASYICYGLHPERVWLAILRNRAVRLGREFYDLPHNKKQPMAESREGNAPQKTCAYGALPDQQTGTSCSTVTKREARRALTSEFGLQPEVPAGVAAPAVKKPCASERRTRKRRAA